jgi:predicted transposase YbfD/YdcC
MKNTKCRTRTISIPTKFKIGSCWAVENKLIWKFGVLFSKDASRKMAGNTAQNYSILTKIALNL